MIGMNEERESVCACVRVCERERDLMKRCTTFFNEVISYPHLIT